MPQPPKDTGTRETPTPSGEPRDEQREERQDASEEQQTKQDAIRSPEHERQLREAHAHPEVDDEGVTTNVRDVMEDYGKHREERAK